MTRASIASCVVLSPFLAVVAGEGSANAVMMTSRSSADFANCCEEQRKACSLLEGARSPPAGRLIDSYLTGSHFTDMVVMGDSWVEYTRVCQHDTWPQFLGKILGVKVHSVANPGDSVKEHMHQQVEKIRDRIKRKEVPFGEKGFGKKTLFVIHFGLNDFLNAGGIVRSRSSNGVAGFVAGLFRRVLQFLGLKGSGETSGQQDFQFVQFFRRLLELRSRNERTVIDEIADRMRKYVEDLYLMGARNFFISTIPLFARMPHFAKYDAISETDWNLLEKSARDSFRQICTKSELLKKDEGVRCVVYDEVAGLEQVAEKIGLDKIFKPCGAVSDKDLSDWLAEFHPSKSAHVHLARHASNIIKQHFLGERSLYESEEGGDRRPGQEKSGLRITSAALYALGLDPSTKVATTDYASHQQHVVVCYSGTTKTTKVCLP